MGAGRRLVLLSHNFFFRGGSADPGSMNTNQHERSLVTIICSILLFSLWLYCPSTTVSRLSDSSNPSMDPNHDHSGHVWPALIHPDGRLYIGASVNGTDMNSEIFDFVSFRGIYAQAKKCVPGHPRPFLRFVSSHQSKRSPFRQGRTGEDRKPNKTPDNQDPNSPIPTDNSFRCGCRRGWG
jgi:hypothetical protein